MTRLRRTIGFRDRVPGMMTLIALAIGVAFVFSGAVTVGYPGARRPGRNVAAIPLAAGVLARWGLVLAPAVGAVLMSVSTIVVAVNAQLLRRTRL